MPNSDLANIFISIEATKDAINYLKKYKIEIVNLAIDKILKTKEPYTYKLKDNDLDKFKDSIIKGHIQWIIEDLYHPNSISFNEFNIYSIKSIPKAYYDIYVYLSQHIHDSSISENSKEILKDYFLALSEAFK